jgi:hypothetical protein
MAEPTYEELKARVAELEKQKRMGGLQFRVSEKGGVSVDGLGRFPLTLYYEQWVHLLDAAQELGNFLEMHKAKLKLGLTDNPENLSGHAYSTPLWVEALVGAINLGEACADGMKAAWDAFRTGYESAYEDAKRARAESNNRGANSSRPSQPAKPWRSPYDVLGVCENAPWSEVKSAYRAAMMNLHPDRVSQTGIDPKTATARTQEVNAAYVELENQRCAP